MMKGLMEEPKFHLVFNLSLLKAQKQVDLVEGPCQPCAYA